jgi:hypothetical protein
VTVSESLCRCGHPLDLHDAHGCAAFLGAFSATKDEKRYCACRQAVVHEPCAPVLGDGDLRIDVAAVRVTNA